MRIFAILFAFGFTGFALSASAASVYLKPTSAYASGEYAAESLQKKTTEVKTQHWYRLRLGAPDTAPVWAPEEFVLRFEDLRGQCFIKRVTDLHLGPHLKTLAIGTLGHGARLTVTGPTVIGTGPRERWVPVQMDDARGFVSRNDLVLPEDIRRGRAILADDGLALRSGPFADADVVGQTHAGQIAIVIEQASLRWGRVALKERGELWWPIDETLASGSGARVSPSLGVAARANEIPKIKTGELFRHHKIHDIASSPVIPNLKILSAQGVFRTIDGEEWEKLPQFKDANYPVAISASGRIYVGSLVSDDQGETFRSFLRIENIVSPLRRRWNTNPKRMRILEIEPQGSDGQKISLKVDIGLEFPVSVATSDQGQTWSAL